MSEERVQARSFEEYILTHKSMGIDGNLHFTVTLEDYHKNYIQPLSKRFSQWDYYSGSKVLCWNPEHDDKNPSVGWVWSRKYKGVKICNCMGGCGNTGTVIQIHQRLQKQYFNRVISEKDAQLEICKLYNIDDSLYVEIDSDQSTYLENSRAVYLAQDGYSERSFADELLTARKEFAVEHDIDNYARKLDSASVKMLATKKGWLAL